MKTMFGSNYIALSGLSYGFRSQAGLRPALSYYIPSRLSRYSPQRTKGRSTVKEVHSASDRKVTTKSPERAI